MRALALVVVALSWVVPLASAQSQGDWLIVPAAFDDDAAWMEPTASSIRSELGERGAEAWSLDGAAKRFEANGSAPAVAISRSSVQQWLERAHRALEHLAGRDYARAERELEAAQAFAKQAAEELNRERDRAQEVLDSCLDIVRLRIEMGSRARAREDARECRQLVPRVEPTTNRHPPSVMEVLREVDEESNGTGVIEVASVPAGCSFRINGLSFGKTPDSLSLFYGEYGVQVECEGMGRGRVHAVNLAGEKTAVFVDSRFDQAVRTRPFLHLRYSDAQAQSKWAVRDAKEILEVVPARAVLLVTSPQAGMMRVERVQKTGEPGGKGRTYALINTGASGPSREDVDLAVKAVLNDECMDFTGARPTELPGCNGGRKSWPEHRTPKAHFWSGIALASLGTLSLATGYGLLVRRGTVGDDFVSDVANSPMNMQPVDNQLKWLNLQPALIATGATGAAALVAAMPLALPYRSKTPWWAWVSGGLGVVALAGSIASGATADSKPDSCVNSAAETQQCVDHGKGVDRAVLLGLTAAPLLTMPLVYLFRPKEAKVTPNIEIGQNGGRVVFTGQF